MDPLIATMSFTTAESADAVLVDDRLGELTADLVTEAATRYGVESVEVTRDDLGINARGFHEYRVTVTEVVSARVPTVVVTEEE